MTRPRFSVPQTDPEDLSARARRGSLSEAEQSELDRVLLASRSVSTAHRVGRDFDRAFQVQSGDERLIAAMADAALGAGIKRALPVRRWSMFALVAALAIAGSAAALSAVLSVRRAPEAVPPNTAPSSAHVEHGERVRATVPPIATAAESSTLPVQATAGPVASLPPSAQPHVVLDASTLFGQASVARRASDFGRARSLYLQLEREFPASSEAHLARVSLGKVLLVMGRAQEAERQFALYLGTGGSLSEEALVGRAQSLARLGRVTEEQSVWQTLLNQYPGSVYASAARARLSASSTERP